MSDLLKSEPDGKNHLYKGVEDDQVDADTDTFTWEWIRKATLLKKKDSFNNHVKKGHFGHVEQISAKNYRMAEGHRAICRFNNKRYPSTSTKIVSRAQHSDMMRRTPVRDMVVMVRGRPWLKPVSLKRYNHDDFIATRRYTEDQVIILAAERVDNDIKSKTVRWHDLPDKSEYQRLYDERVRMFQDLYASEMILVAKDTASKEDIRAAADLPAGILAMINYKLTLTQANYYISRFVEFQRIESKAVSDPILSYRIHQVILEEIQIEHLRDLQRLYGDEINKQVEDALEKALKRHQVLMPIGKGSSPGNDGEGTTGSGPYTPPSVEEDPFERDELSQPE